MSPWCRTTESWLWNSNKLLRDTLASTPTITTTTLTMMVVAMLTTMVTLMAMSPPLAMAIVELLPVLRVGPDVEAEW